MTVVCVGLATLDVVHRVDVLPGPGSKGWARSTELAAGGPAANAAVTAAALLGTATLVTVLGNGAAAAVVRADLERHGVTVIDLDPRAGTLPVASCAITPDGERTVVSPGARASTAALDAAARDAVAASTVLLLDGHHPSAAEEALDLATGVRVLDAGSAKPRAEGWLARLDVVAGSADYARALPAGGGPVGDDLRLLDAALQHVLDAGAAAAVMTDGPRPVRWRTPAAAGEIPVGRVQAVDTLGAGDAFHGALAAALAVGRPLPDAVALAASVATARVQRPGARAWLGDIGPLR